MRSKIVSGPEIIPPVVPATVNLSLKPDNTGGVEYIQPLPFRIIKLEKEFDKLNLKDKQYLDDINRRYPERQILGNETGLTSDEINRRNELAGKIRKLKDEVRGICSLENLKFRNAVKRRLRASGIKFSDDLTNHELVKLLKKEDKNESRKLEI